MKGIKGLHVSPRFAALLLATSMAFSLTGCGGHVDMKTLSPSEVLEIQDVKDVTLADELIANNQLTFYEDLDVIEAADQLERYLDILDITKGMDFTNVGQLQPLTDEQYQEALSLPLEEIRTLKEQAAYTGKDIVQLEQKLKALKQLDYLDRHCEEWVHRYGQSISIQYMMAAVKGSVADELELSVDDYKKITIPPRRSFSEPEEYTIEVGDTIYRVPVGVGEIWNTIHYIYEVQDATLEGDKEYETYRKALNYGKVTMAAGCNEKKGKLTEQYSASYIEKNYVK